MEAGPYAHVKEVRRHYAIVCERHNIKPVDDLESCIDDLNALGIVDVKGLTKIGVSEAPVEGLRSFLEHLLERVHGAIKK